MGRWYSPDESWPPHPQRPMNEVLKYARRRRWWLQTFDGHAFGEIRCRPPQEKPFHRERVLSSGRGSESVALTIRGKIDRCAHPRPGDDILDRVSLQLDKAAAALRAADLAIARDLRAERVRELLDDASLSLRDDDVMTELESILDEDQIGDAELSARLGEAGLDVAKDVSPALLLSAVERMLTDAADHLHDAPRSERRRELQRAFKVLRVALRDLRRHLDGGLE